MTDLILTGFMGTGKTVVGRILAERHGLEFVDTDDEVERCAGCTIAELWSAKGEPAFRDLEAKMFRKLIATPGERVISTGAGTLVSERNRAVLPSTARVICLDCHLDALIARLLPVQAQRPILAGLNREELMRCIQARQDSRKQVYDLFDRVDTSDRSAEDVATEIAARFGLVRVTSLCFNEERDSRILFGRGLLASLGDIIADSPAEVGVGGGDVMLITDDETWTRGALWAWPRAALNSLHRAGFNVYQARIPAGEEHKILATVARIYDRCLDSHLDRSATIVAVGGGVVGDVAGLVAATYLRGLPLVLVPTTLLAQVDAAIGGKVGVDFQGAKNLVGAFYPARAVVIDPDVLATLPRASLSAGLAEIVKIAWVRSACLLRGVETLATVDSILSQLPIVRRAVMEKARLVQDDPYERGDRALLNFGHTIGHGLEAASGYRLAHGQSIGVGMVAEAWLAERRGWCVPGVLGRLSATLRRLELPLAAPGLDSAAVFDFVEQDKKRRAGTVRFALPGAPGEGILVDVTEADVRQAIEYAVGRAV